MPLRKRLETAEEYNLRRQKEAFGVNDKDIERWNKEEKIKNIICRIVLILLILICGKIFFSFFTEWSDYHDQIIQTEATAYEKCFEAQYHMNPSAYMDLHGELPECSN